MSDIDSAFKTVLFLSYMPLPLKPDIVNVGPHFSREQSKSCSAFRRPVAMSNYNPSSTLRQTHLLQFEKRKS